MTQALTEQEANLRNYAASEGVRRLKAPDLAHIVRSTDDDYATYSLLSQSGSHAGFGYLYEIYGRDVGFGRRVDFFQGGLGSRAHFMAMAWRYYSRASSEIAAARGWTELAEKISNYYLLYKPPTDEARDRWTEGLSHR
jgi:hypothetical protein